MVQTAHRIVRCTVTGHVGSHEIANVFHMYTDENAGLEGRQDAIDFALSRLGAAWQENMLDVIGSGYVYDGIDWVDLDSADGATGHYAPDPDLPTAGTQGGTQMPPNVAVLIRKEVSGGRGTRSGRFYVAQVPENDADNVGVLSDARHTAWQLTADAFLDQANDSAGGGGGFSDHCHMVTVTFPTITVGGRKVPDPDGVGTAHNVTGLQVATTLATQRRRLRR